jgi:hypothetical protein
MSCVTFWVVLRRMVFDSQRFGTLCLFHLHRRVDAKMLHTTITVVFVGFSRKFLLGILIFKVLTARRIYKSFGV